MMRVLSYEEITNGEDGIWKPFMRHWISSLGKVKNCFGKTKILSSKGVYYINKNNKLYLGPLLAKAFQIPNYEKLDDNTNNFYVTKINLSTEMTADNIKVVHKSEIITLTYNRSSNFTDKASWHHNYFEKIPSLILSEFPKHTIYSNGEIWNGTRWLVFSKCGSYFQLSINGKTMKLHRLICFAFNPIDNKLFLADYDNLQVNHIDGNTFNNSADNLEWCSQSNNMQHAYDNDLNLKKRGVNQYCLLNKTTILQSFESISKASKFSGEPEHRIRNICNNKSNSKAMYYWQWMDKSESDEYRKKYSTFMY